MHTFSLPAVNVVARSLIPLTGIVLLGWSSANLLIVYCADTWIAVAVQFVGALGMTVQDHQVLHADRNPALRLKRRFAFLFLRWVVVFMALQLAVLFGTRGAGFVLVLAYAAATVALELYPNAVMRAFHAPDLADDGDASGRASTAPDRRPAPPAQRSRFSHRIEE